MSTLQRRRMMMAQGVTYKGIPLMITNVGDEPSVITLIPYGSFNAQIYYKQDNDKFYKKWNYNAITLPTLFAIILYLYLGIVMFFLQVHLIMLILASLDHR